MIGLARAEPGSVRERPAEQALERRGIPLRQRESGRDRVEEQGEIGPRAAVREAEPLEAGQRNVPSAGTARPARSLASSAPRSGSRASPVYAARMAMPARQPAAPL